MKIKRGIIGCISAVLIMCIVSGCGIFGNPIVGEWYNERDKCLSIRKDGTYKKEGEYGTGKWKMLDEDTIEFIDYYGDPDEAEICEDENGKYIEFGNHEFRKKSN